MGGLYVIKPWFVRRLRRIEDALVARTISADALTLAAVAVSAAAGAVIALGGALGLEALWLLVGPLVLVRLALNALDGSVARRARSARPFGVVLNEVGDRAGDVCLVGATAFVVGPAPALGAVAAATLASLTGVLALAVTGRRDCGGPLGKADRAVVLALGTSVGAFTGPIAITVSLGVIAWGSLVTAGARVGRIKVALDTAPVFEIKIIEIDSHPTEVDDAFAG